MNSKLLEKISSYEKVEAVYKRKGYQFFHGDYNVNLFGVRADCAKSGQFDDFLCLAYEAGKKQFLLTAPGTTDPGAYYLENPMNVLGTAILVPGQYKNVFILGKYKDQPAFKQIGTFKVYRDNNKNAIIDKNSDSTFSGYFGIHLHGKRGILTKSIGKWSAGCQVPENDDDLKLFYSIAEKGVPKYGNRVTYTLFDEKDFD